MRRDMLVLGFLTSQMTIAANLAGLSHEQSLDCPVKAGNCVNWIAGHLLTSRNGLEKILQLDGAPALTEQEAKLYVQGSSPLLDPDSAVKLERLVAELQKASDAIIAKVQSLSEQELDALLDPKMFPGPVNRPSLDNLLTLFLFHEAYHSGQIGLGRRLLGEKSGIRV